MIHVNPQGRALRLKKRSWWVCCYGHRPIRQPKNMRQFPNQLTWDLAPNPWEGDDTRRWQLIDVKTFPSLFLAYLSACYQRRYAPYSHTRAWVVLMQRTTDDISCLTEYRLYPFKEPT